MKILYAALALAFAGAPVPAAAQFTAAVVPPKPVVHRDTTTRRDSLAHAKAQIAQRMSDMKSWVDSAAKALAVAPPEVPAESAAAATISPSSPPAPHGAVTTASAGEVVNRSEGDTTFRNGGRAPATASSLPILALLGAGTLLVGVALLRR